MDDRRCFVNTLRENLEQLGLSTDAGQLDQMWCHFELLLEANRGINLTRITGPAQAAAKHYADALAVAAWCDTTGWVPTTVLDVGTGGGFPAIPLAIARPAWQVTAVDSTAKKVRCVQDFVERLGLANCRVVHQRIKRAGGFSPRGPADTNDAPNFDLILFRAIAPIADCLKLAKPFCHTDSVVVCYKSDPLDSDERRRAERQAAKLGLKKLPAWPYRIDCDEETISYLLCCYQFVSNEP